MPRMKTKKSAAKRFKLTARGKIVRKHAFRSHLLSGKRPGRKRRLERPDLVSEREEHRILGLLPYRRFLR